jgi:hypothetical protein
VFILNTLGLYVIVNVNVCTGVSTSIPVQAYRSICACTVSRPSQKGFSKACLHFRCRVKYTFYVNCYSAYLLASSKIRVSRSPSQWPSGLRRGSAADRLVGLRNRIPPGTWMFVLCVVSKDKKAKCRQSRQRHKYGWSKNRVQENTMKIPPGSLMSLLIVVDYQVEVSVRADHSSRGVLSRVLSWCVI